MENGRKCVNGQIKNQNWTEGQEKRVKWEKWASKSEAKRQRGEVSKKGEKRGKSKGQVRKQRVKRASKRDKGAIQKCNWASKWEAKRQVGKQKDEVCQNKSK